MPNYFVPSGPNGIVTTGSFLPVLEFVTTYIMSCIEKMERERISSMTPKTSAIKAYHRHCNAYFGQTVYSEPCSTWMRASKNYPDRITAIYPGSYLHFRDVLSHPRWEDYDYEMVDDDLFDFMGNGMMADDIAMKGDFAPYMNLREEFPELREFFTQDEASNLTNEISPLNGSKPNGSRYLSSKTSKSDGLVRESEVDSPGWLPVNT
jgi:hypothetical protein